MRPTLLRLISLLREPHWLTRRRVVAWSALLLVEELFLLLFAALWLHGFVVKAEAPTSTDFVSFYAAGKLTLAGAPASAYDQAAHYLAEQQATAPGVPYMLFVYPPVFLFLCAALATLPYLVAFAVFQLVTLAMFVGVMRGVLRGKGWGWIAPLLAFPAVIWNLGLGQNAFLTAALLGGFTLLIDRRPGSAGMLLGMLCYKPHFGLLAPFALAAGSRWRAFFAASLTMAVLVGTSIALFGWKTWDAYFTAFAGSREIYQSGRVDFAGMVTLFGAARRMGLHPGPAYAVQTVMAVLMAGLIVFIWRSGMSRPLRGASLLAATLLSVPLALFYDELLALVAICWLVREASEHGFLPWEKILLVASYPLSLFTWTIATAWHVPLGPVVNLTILSLCLRRAWRTRGAAATISSL